jgi:hypothetical protein
LNSFFYYKTAEYPNTDHLLDEKIKKHVNAKINGKLERAKLLSVSISLKN